MLADCSDLDLASSGTLLIPGTHYIGIGGKKGVIYVLDRANLGHFDDAGERWRSFESVSKMWTDGAHKDVPDDPKHDRVRQKIQAGENQYDDHFNISELMSWPHIHGTPVFAHFSGDEAFMFVWAEKDRIKRYPLARRYLRCFAFSRHPPAPAPPYHTDRLNGMPGGMLSVNVDPNS